MEVREGERRKRTGKRGDRGNGGTGRGIEDEKNKRDETQVYSVKLISTLDALSPPLPGF